MDESQVNVLKMMIIMEAVVIGLLVFFLVISSEKPRCYPDNNLVCKVAYQDDSLMSNGMQVREDHIIEIACGNATFENIVLGTWIVE